MSKYHHMKTMYPVVNSWEYLQNVNLDQIHGFLPMVEIEIILHAFEGFLHVLLVGVRGHAIAYFAGFYTYCSLSYIHLVYFEDKYM